LFRAHHFASNFLSKRNKACLERGVQRQKMILSIKIMEKSINMKLLAWKGGYCDFERPSVIIPLHLAINP
jgi:hypothetical protein